DLAEHGVVHADHGHFGDAGHLLDGVLDVGRIHAVGAGLDHVAAAAGEVEETVLVEVAAVACVQPAVTQHARGFPGGVPVAEHDVRTLGQDVPLDARGHVPAGLVDDAQAHAAERPPHRTGLVHQALGGQV